MSRAAGLALVAALPLLGCGGGSSPSTPSGPAAPVAAASPVPTAQPTPTPTPDPRIGLPPGPVARYTIKVRTINNGEREPDVDSQGRYVVHPTERVDFDSTQKNEGNEICAWVDTPHWYVDGREVPLESGYGIIYRRGSSQPFLLKLTIQGTGSFQVSASLDGVTSNVLVIRSVD